MQIRKPGLISQVRHLLLLVPLLGMVLFSRPDAVFAQGATPASGLRIPQATLQLWPEYDDPGVLVIYSGAFDPAASFPQEVRFPVPPGTREIQATYSDSSGRLLNQEFQVVDGQLVYTLPGPGFHVEYYLDRPTGGEQRDIPFSFQSQYPVDQLDIRVKEPSGAVAFNVAPAATPAGTDGDGFKVHALRQSSIAAGQPLPITLRYNRSEQSPSVQRQVQQESPASAAEPAALPDTAGSISPLPYILIGVGVAVLAGAGAYWLLERRRAATPSAPVARSRGREAEAGARSGRAPEVSRGAAKASSGATAFCPRCGRRFSPEDQFCGQCGAPRK